MHTYFSPTQIKSGQTMRKPLSIPTFLFLKETQKNAKIASSPLLVNYSELFHTRR